MTAPSPTNRVTPSTIAMPDGFSTLITLGEDENIEFWEKTVQPPGMDGGDAIEISTMHNTAWRTMAARSLKTLTDISITAAYDAVVYASGSVLSAINREDTITVTFSDGAQLAFFGYLRSFTPSDVSEGEQPEATVVITPTNIDPVAFTEEGPVIASVTGTP